MICSERVKQKEKEKKNKQKTTYKTPQNLASSSTRQLSPTSKKTPKH